MKDDLLMKRIFVFFFLLILLTGCSSEQKEEPLKKNVIAVLDTGISTTAIKGENILEGWNYVTNNSDTEDRINHGTAVTSVIVGCDSAEVTGIVNDAKIVPLVVTDKVDGEVQSVSPEILAKAIRDSVDKYGASVINVSLGTKKDTPELREAIEYVQKKGALVIAAAGNSGDTEELYYPSAYDGVLTVGSHDKDMEISDFTQQNGTVDILAPGEDIWLASRNGKKYGAKGTSYATGFVSAAALKIWEDNPDLKAEEVKKQILEKSTTVEDRKILNVSDLVENKK